MKKLFNFVNAPEMLSNFTSNSYGKLLKKEIRGYVKKKLFIRTHSLGL